MESATAEPLRPPADEERLARARRRVAALKSFYIHLFLFALVMVLLTAVNAAVGGPWWVLWVLLGWGIGVVAHGLTVYGQTSRAIAAWEERKLREFIDDQR